jgi:protein-disulfide isomerase
MSRLTLPVSKRDHMQGDPKAPLTWSSMATTSAPTAAAPIRSSKRVQARLGNRLCFVFRNFPLAEIHPHAEAAAEAAESVGAHGGEKAFWAMHDLIFEHQASLTDPALARMAVEAGVDPDDVLTDLSSRRLRDRVREDFMSGVKSGVNGTPTFFINGVRYDGSWDEENLVAELEETLLHLA